MPTIKLRLPSNRTLGNICVYGAVFSISAVMYMRWKLEDRVRSQDFYKLALQHVRSHKGAVKLLGEPIKDSGFDMSNVNNTCDEHRAQLEVNVRGSKDKGTVYFWATNQPDKGWLIERLELEAKQHPNKRFLLKKPNQLTFNEANAENQISAHSMELPPQSMPANGGRQESFFTAQATAQTLQQSEEPMAYIQTAEGGRMQ
ncbi:CG31913 [Drosophila busckii]|uniref:CG31913 n=1 Tax=Drosophila busckii TaxID=30019 RepID=A0A0M4ESW4_DROBS|nr:uncharacterized protein LOC108596345 [Drosophila busckii]ALC40500.1 CG31913 [Drosophila busckii]